MTRRSARRTLAQLLDEARARIERLEPREAYAAQQDGALLVDIRSDLDRGRNGVVPGAIHIPRTVLEWRLDPDGEFRSPYVRDVERRVVLLCDHGCSSQLAAASLAELGFRRVGDVVGGFEAWQAAGLPIAQAQPSRAPGELAGMQPPD